MKSTSKGEDLPQELRKLWKNGLFRAVFSVAIVILGVLVFREVLIIVLRTNNPLATPISGSMEPTLNKGDLLIVQGGLSADDIVAGLKPNGTIIVFRDPRDPDGIPIVHRVIDKYQIGETWYFVTKGDNPRNPIDDWSWVNPLLFPKGGKYHVGGVPESYVFGKVIAYIPYLGYIKLYLGTPIGMAISIILLVALLLLENMTSSERIENPKSAEMPRKETENQRK